MTEHLELITQFLQRMIDHLLRNYLIFIKVFLILVSVLQPQKTVLWINGEVYNYSDIITDVCLLVDLLMACVVTCNAYILFSEN